MIRAITERVLNNVVEQLPKALSSSTSADEGNASGALAANAMAIQALDRDLERARDDLEGLEDRLIELEGKVRWRLYAWIAITAIVVYAIGFGTAVGLKTVGII